MRLSSGRVNGMQRIAWIDVLRVLGALMIFVYHFSTDYERTLGSSPFGSSFLNASWPHFNTWAISLFVVLAGMSLTLSWRPPVRLGTYLRRRALRLLVPLWIIGVPYVIAGLALGLMTPAELWKVPVWFAGLGVISPATFLPVSEAWWYVTVALQCALVAPVVMRPLDRLGLAPTLAGVVAVTLASLLVIGRLPAEWHYLAQGLALARLIEFGAGVLAARVLRGQVGAGTSVSLGLGLAVAALLADRLGAVTPGATVTVLIVVVIGLALLVRSGPVSPGWLVSAGLATYPFYLAHAPIGAYSIRVLTSLGATAPWLLAAVALGISCAAAAAVTMLDRRASAFFADRREHPPAH